jgi:sugar lactone lactonase YvrE
VLGEGPLWSAELQCLLFVDIKKPSILKWCPNGPAAIFPLQKEIGAIALCKNGGIVAALKDEFALIQLEPFTLTPIVLPEPEPLGNRFNDGKCDPAGRFWAASMDDACASPTGAIWRLSADLKVDRMSEGYVVGNGFGWSPDGKTMYFTDSHNRTIFAYPFDQASGSLGKRRCFAVVPDDEGYPDGLTVDADGHVWSAHWDGGKITRYRPDGTVDYFIPMPVPRPTSLAFGGADFRQLYVTSASIGLSVQQIQESPLSGGLFVVEAGVAGRPEPYFAG